MAVRIFGTWKRSGRFSFLTRGVIASGRGMGTATLATAQSEPLLQPEVASTTSATWSSYAEPQPEAQATPTHDENEWSEGCDGDCCPSSYSTKGWFSCPI